MQSIEKLGAKEHGEYGGDTVLEDEQGYIGDTDAYERRGLTRTPCRD